MKQRYWLAVVLASLCLGSLFVLTQTYSAGVPVYDPWADINDDGWVNAKDAIVLGNAFSSSGTPLEKASITFDSGWLNITDKCGQYFNVTHNLNIADWNDPNMTVDITGKTTPTSELLRFLGLTGQQGWNKTYGGTEGDRAFSLVQTGDGGYAMAGTTSSHEPGNGDFWLVKTDAGGSMLWNKTYGGGGWDGVTSLVQTWDGGYALLGITTSFGAGDYDFWLVKTDASGNEEWNKNYGGTNLDEAFSLVQTGDGGYAIAGTTNSFGAGSWDSWLVKTDAGGSMLWNKTYGGTGTDAAYSLVQTGDGGYAIAGDTSSFGAGMGDFWLVKTDANGNAQWNQTYGGTDFEMAFALVRTSGGGYALAGYTASFGAGDYDFWLVKTDANGNMMWNKTYGGTSDDVARSLVQTWDGGYALAGCTQSFGNGGWPDFWLVKTDAGGNMMWNKTYGGTSDDEAMSLVQTGDGGYALAGYTASFGAGGDDVWLVKMDASGNIRESGLAWVGSTSDSITLYRGAADPCWNYVRVQIWKRR